MLVFNEQCIETCEDGYLTKLDDWSLPLAHFLAAQEGIDLNGVNQRIVLFCRDFYLEFKRLPPIRAVVKELKQHFDDTLANSVYLQTTFPVSPARQIAKIAGLPKPARCM